MIVALTLSKEELATWIGSSRRRGWASGHRVRSGGQFDPVGEIFAINSFGGSLKGSLVAATVLDIQPLAERLPGTYTRLAASQNNATGETCVSLPSESRRLARVGASSVHRNAMTVGASWPRLRGKIVRRILTTLPLAPIQRYSSHVRLCWRQMRTSSSYS